MVIGADVPVIVFILYVDYQLCAFRALADRHCVYLNDIDLSIDDYNDYNDSCILCFETLRQCMLVIRMFLFYFSPYLLYLVIKHDR